METFEVGSISFTPSLEVSSGRFRTGAIAATAVVQHCKFFVPFLKQFRTLHTMKRPSLFSPLFAVAFDPLPLTPLPQVAGWVSHLFPFVGAARWGSCGLNLFMRPLYASFSQPLHGASFNAHRFFSFFVAPKCQRAENACQGHSVMLRGEAVVLGQNFF